METALTSKTLVTLYQTTSRHNSEDGNLQVLNKLDMRCGDHIYLALVNNVMNLRAALKDGTGSTICVTIRRSTRTLLHGVN
jgi:hypothetical protein